MSTPRFAIARDLPSDSVGTRLALSGEFDLAAHEALLAEISQAINSSVPAVVIDLDRVTFVDSGGIGVLVNGYHSAREAGCGYQVINAQGIVKQVLEITGVLGVLSSGSPTQRGAGASQLNL